LGSISDAKREVAAYLRDHPGLSLRDLERYARSHRDLESSDAWLAKNGLPDTDDNEIQYREFKGALEHIASLDYRHPGLAHAKLWGLWLLICGLAPALLLGITAWIIRGFERQTK
jgi:hypothetical protein